MKYLSLTITLLLLVLSPIKQLMPHASAQGWVWGKYNTGDGVDSWPVTTDPSGNVYGAGIALGSTSPITFGSHSVPLVSSSMWGTQTIWVKYDPSGNVIYADGTSYGNTWILNIATDRSSNLIIFGAFQSDSMRIGSFGLKNKNVDGSPQYFLAKVDPTGTVLWALCDGNCTYYFSAASIFILGGGGVTTDSKGNIYVTTSFTGKTATIGSTVLTNADATGAANDVLVAKYDPSGTLIWATSLGGSSNDYAASIVETTGGFLYVCGAFTSTTLPVGPVTLTNPSNIDMAYIAKLNSTTGAHLWADKGLDTKPSVATGLARDKTGNVYMTGAFEGNSITFGGTALSRAYPPSGSGWSDQALFLVRYDPSGTLTWNKTISSQSAGVWGYCIALASCGQVWVSGNYTQDAVIDAGDTLKPAKPITGSPDPIFLAGYNLTGGVVGYAGLASGGDDQNGIACDPSGNVFACSDYYNEVLVGRDTLPSQIGSEFFYMGKYSNVIKTDTVFSSHHIAACSADMTIYATAGYAGYVWEDGSEDSARVISAVGTYFVSGFSCGKPVAIDTYYVTIIPADTTFHTHVDSICATSTPYTLTASPSDTAWKWSTGATTSSIDVNVSTPGTVIYYVVGKFGCTQFIIDTFTMITKPLPVVSAGNDTAICAGNSVLLQTIQPPGSTFLWSTGATTDTIRINTSGFYSVKVTAPNGCVNSDTMQFTVKPNPVVDLGPDLFNCNELFDTLASSVTYVSPTYKWSDASTGATDVVKVTGKYWLEVTVNGCKGADTIKTTIIYDTLHFYNHDTAICRGALVAAFVTGNPEGQTYQWLPTAGIAASTIINPVIMADTSATYVLRTSMPLCPDRLDSFHIDVQPNPTVHIGDNRMVCQFDSVHLVAAVTPKWYQHYIYKWSPAANIDNTNQSAVTFTAGNYTQLFLNVSTPAGCSAKDSAEMIVHPGNFAVMQPSFDICPGEPVQFKPAGGVAYQWNPGIYLDDSFSRNPLAKAITSQSYRMIATSNYGCRDTIMVRINVHPAGVLNLGNSITLYPGQSYHITPQTNCSKFAWHPATGLDNAFISDPVAKPDVSTRYFVNATNEWGCKATDSIDVKVEPGTLLELPNAFTPGQGSNAKFTVIKKGIADLKYFRIFNRWGNKVFETSNIDEGWDGTFNGVPQPFGVYVYEVGATTSQGKDFEKHGNVTLIR